MVNFKWGMERSKGWVRQESLEELLIESEKRDYEKEKSRIECPEKLEYSDDYVNLNRLSSLSKPNKIVAFMPDFSLSNEELVELGFEKEDDGWHVSNREYFPNAISDNDIMVVYGPNDLGFFSKN